MAYKLGFMLSLVFLVNLFVMAGDIFAIQVIYTNIDAVSVTVSNLISSNAQITQDVVNIVEKETGGYIVEVGENEKKIGTVFRYKIVKEYDPWFISSNIINVTVVRSVVIGYYN